MLGTVEQVCFATSVLFRSRIVFRVDVGDTPGTDAVELNDRFLLGPGEVIRLGLHDRNASRHQRSCLLHIQCVADTHVKGAGENGYPLHCRMPVRGKLVGLPGI